MSEHVRAWLVDAYNMSVHNPGGSECFRTEMHVAFCVCKTLLLECLWMLGGVGPPQSAPSPRSARGILKKLAGPIALMSEGVYSR